MEPRGEINENDDDFIYINYKMNHLDGDKTLDNKVFETSSTPFPSILNFPLTTNTTSPKHHTKAP